MAFVDYETLVDDLSALVVPGIRHRYTNPPDAINEADMPFSFPLLPEGEQSIISLGGVSGLREARAELMVLVNPLRLDLSSINFRTSVRLIDAYGAVLSANATALGLDGWGFSKPDYAFNDMPYWALLLTVEASG